MAKKKKDPEYPLGTLFWHVHHEELAEPLSEPLSARIAYINNNKPHDEIEIRLRLMTPVLGTDTLPKYLTNAISTWVGKLETYLEASIVETTLWKAKFEALRGGDQDAFDAAQEAYMAVRDPYRNALHAESAAFRKVTEALHRAQPKLGKLHAIEHPHCPWNGFTIFPLEVPA